MKGKSMTEETKLKVSHLNQRIAELDGYRWSPKLEIKDTAEVKAARALIEKHDAMVERERGKATAKHKKQVRNIRELIAFGKLDLALTKIKELESE